MGLLGGRMQPEAATAAAAAAQQPLRRGGLAASSGAGGGEVEGACGAPWRAPAAAGLDAGATVAAYRAETALPAGSDAAGSTTGLSIAPAASAHTRGR